MKDTHILVISCISTLRASATYMPNLVTAKANYLTGSVTSATSGATPSSGCPTYVAPPQPDVILIHIITKGLICIITKILVRVEIL